MSTLTSAVTPTTSTRNNDRPDTSNRTRSGDFETSLLASVVREMRASTSRGAAALESAASTPVSTRMQNALDALSRIAVTPTAVATPASESNTREIIAPATTSVAPATETRLASTARTGWNSMRLDAPASGGSGALWEGFNNDRAMAGGDNKSAKDAFFRWTYGLSFNPDGKSKQEIEAFLRDNIDSAREYGLNILDVSYETILVECQEGVEWIDLVRGAGAPGAAWQWLSQTAFGVAAGGGTLGQTLLALRQGDDGAARVRDLLTGTTATGDALLSELRAEVAAAARGETTLAARRAPTPTPTITTPTPVTTPPDNTLELVRMVEPTEELSESEATAILVARFEQLAERLRAGLVEDGLLEPR